MNTKVKVNPWWIAVSVMLGTFMEVMDTSITNVALQHIAGSLSVSSDDATWVITTYLISNAIVIPSTAWFGQKFGRKRFLVTCVGVFTVASFFSGLATSLPTLLFWQIVMGAGGGALQPIAQAVLFESFPKEKHGQAMAVYSMGIVMGPILGPVLGGWITDNYSWRWIFFINLPVGALAIMLMRKFIQDPPWVADSKPPRLDIIGFAFMSLWLGCQEVMLDKGQEDDWFGSPFITYMAILAAIGFVVFIVRELMVKRPFVDLRVLKNYNFRLGVGLMFFGGVLLYGITLIIPLFLQSLLGYTATLSGYAMISRGVGAFVAIMITGRLIGRIPGRYIVAAGFLISALSSLALTRITLDISWQSLVWPVFFTGAGVGVMLVALNTLTFSMLKPEEMGNASGVFNLMRNLGGSVGISLVTTLIDRRAQTHQTFLVGHATPYDPAYQSSLKVMTSALAGHSGHVYGAEQALGALYNKVLGQAYLLAYLDNFYVLTAVSILCVTGALFFKRAKSKGPVAVH